MFAVMQSFTSCYATVAPTIGYEVNINTNDAYSYDYLRLNNAATDTLIYPAPVDQYNLFIKSTFRVNYPQNKTVHIIVEGLKIGGDYVPVCDFTLLSTMQNNGFMKTQVNSIPVAGSLLSCAGVLQEDSNYQPHIILTLKSITPRKHT